MTLAQIFNLVNKRTFFRADDDEVWAAINLAAQRLFQEVQEENRGFFVAFDTSSLVLAVNTEEYVVPAACSQILRLRERVNASSPWNVILPAEDLNSSEYVNAQFPEYTDLNGPASQFEYYGPYLTMADAQTVAKQQRIRIEPPPIDARQTELVYIAKFVEINSAASPKCIPDEGDGAIVYEASCDLLSAVEGVEQQLLATSALRSSAKTQFMKWVRSRQKQRVRQVEPYIQDLD